MRAIQYRYTGGPDVFELVDRAVPAPGQGEVRVQIVRSGVNPTDWKSRRGTEPGMELPTPQVPGMDGSGIVDAVGAGVTRLNVGDRVWTWLATDRRSEGTAQEFVCLPAEMLARFPDDVSFDLGASLGIPFLTAHLCLTSGRRPSRLQPGALSGQTVLVAGGAGAVGNAAVQLAKWAGAELVIATVSGDEKAALAKAAGAHAVVDYRSPDAATDILALAPNRVDLVVEVAPQANVALDLRVVAPGGVIAVYGRDSLDLTVPVWPNLQRNVLWQFHLGYTASPDAKAGAIDAICDAVATGHVRVGAEGGLPLHHYQLADAADAYAAVEAGAVGKVIIDVASPLPRFPR